MCDYSLMHVKSRPASVGDKLRTSNFGTGTRGFAAPEDPTTAVCVLPGTELAFDREISVYGASGPTPHKTAIFRQINKEQPHMHHDALELPDGQTLLLTFMCEGQEATVLQLPAKPRTETEAQAQQRAVFAGELTPALGRSKLRSARYLFSPWGSPGGEQDRPPPAQEVAVAGALRNSTSALSSDAEVILRTSPSNALLDSELRSRPWRVCRMRA